MERKIIKYSDAEKLIEEGDVLLFRHGEFPSIGWWISMYTGGAYSHVGVAHRHDEHLFCVEFREFIGGRAVSLATQVKKFPNTIDVFRPAKKISNAVLEDEAVKYIDREFSPEIAKEITGTVIRLTGQNYGWYNIWKIVQYYIPILRLTRERSLKDTLEATIFVCSTAVAHAFRKHYYDPVNFVPDDITTPVDLSRSPIFNYLFTIGTD